MKGVTRLIALTGPTGVGKTTLLEAALAQETEEKILSSEIECEDPNTCKRRMQLKRLVTYTTRNSRPDEMDGVHYRFVTQAEFNTLLKDGALLEVDVYNGHHYGIPMVTDNDDNTIFLTAVNFNGVKNLKRCWGELVKTICLVADIDTIKQRLVGRAESTFENSTSSPNRCDINSRIELAECELRLLTSTGRPFIDFYLENFSLAKTINALRTLINVWTGQF